MFRSRRRVGVLALLTVSLVGALSAGLIRASSAHAAIVKGGTSYDVATSSGNPLPLGLVDTGNHCDDCTTTVALPFSYPLYDQSFSSVNVSSNGVLEFVGTNTSFGNTNLPNPGFVQSIFPFWVDLLTTGCAFPNAGVYTSVSGVAPNRVFNIEWIACNFVNTAQLEQFTVSLYEDSSRGIQHFDVTYGTVVNGLTNSADPFPTIGVQKDTSNFTQDTDFNGSPIPFGTRLSFSLKQATTTTVSCAPNPANFGQPVTCTATVTPAVGGTPTGTVTFEDNGAIIAGCFAVPLNQLNPDQASCTFTPTAGSHTITAIYSGDANFFGSTGTTTLNVQSGTLTVTKNLISNPLDPSKFNLRIDGVTKAACVGNNGTTGPVTVSVGLHNVSETACAGTNIFAFTTYIKCVDDTSGATVAAGYTRSLNVFINNGQSVTCTIRNQRKLVRIT